MVRIKYNYLGNYLKVLWFTFSSHFASFEILFKKKSFQTLIVKLCTLSQCNCLKKLYLRFLTLVYKAIEVFRRPEVVNFNDIMPHEKYELFKRGTLLADQN